MLNLRDFIQRYRITLTWFFFCYYLAVILLLLQNIISSSSDVIPTQREPTVAKALQTETEARSWKSGQAHGPIESNICDYVT